MILYHKEVEMNNLLTLDKTKMLNFPKVESS